MPIQDLFVSALNRLWKDPPVALGALLQNLVNSRQARRLQGRSNCRQDQTGVELQDLFKFEGVILDSGQMASPVLSAYSQEECSPVEIALK